MVVLFSMMNDEVEVPCAISTDALDSLEKSGRIAPAQRAAQFERLRDRIEDCAIRRPNCRNSRASHPVSSCAPPTFADGTPPAFAVIAFQLVDGNDGGVQRSKQVLKCSGDCPWCRNGSVRSCLVGDAKRGWRGLRSGDEAADADLPMRFERFAAVSRALVEIVIGEVVLRAGSDVEPDHLANVIRAVRKA